MIELDINKRYSAEQCIQHKWIIKYAQSNQQDIPIISNALQNMKNFRAEQKLTEATWTFIVNYLATAEEKKELLKTFQQLDLNGDGQLSREEMITGYKKYMPEEDAIKNVEYIMNKIDKNQNGTIDYTEFVIASIDKKYMLTNKKLEAAFRILDADGSGLIELQEVKDAFGVNISKKVWDEIIKDVDENSDGKILQISFEEFKQMMIKLL